MFALLTKYLLQFRKVVIPNIGGLELISKPSELDFAKRLLYPPAFSIQFFNALYADKHQIDYIAHSLQLDEPTAVEQLNAFGTALKGKIEDHPFNWNGIGMLAASNGETSFNPETFSTTALQPIEAHRVLREKSSHAVLIGEQEVQSHEAKEWLQNAGQEREATAVIAPKRNYFVLTGWILVLLSLVFVLFHFYSKGFKTFSTGNNTHVNAKPAEPTYR